MLKDGVIKDLYYGKLAPYEQTTEEKEPTEKYKHESEKASQLYEDLKKLLTKADHELLDNFIESSNYLNACDGAERFKQGFILGAKLMNELYTDDKFKK